eukprot:scaffold763_cov98-Cylindrotheca_fusiformis.AAC.5
MKAESRGIPVAWVSLGFHNGQFDEKPNLMISLVSARTKKMRSDFHDCLPNYMESADGGGRAILSAVSVVEAHV